MFSPLVDLLVKKIETYRINNGGEYPNHVAMSIKKGDDLRDEIIDNGWMPLDWHRGKRVRFMSVEIIRSIDVEDDEIILG